MRMRVRICQHDRLIGERKTGQGFHGPTRVRFARERGESSQVYTSSCSKWQCRIPGSEPRTAPVLPQPDHPNPATFVITTFLVPQNHRARYLPRSAISTFHRPTHQPLLPTTPYIKSIHLPLPTFNFPTTQLSNLTSPPASKP